MIPTNDRIIVRVDVAQKNAMLIGDVKITMAQKYEVNNREKNPVIAQMVEGNDRLLAGDIILCHHNHFSDNSPYHLQDDLYSIPANHTIFAILKPSGDLEPVYGNVLAGKLWVETPLPIPAESRTYHKDRGRITHGGWTRFRPGDLVFTRPSAIYEIVYNVNGVEHRVCKIDSRQICGCVGNAIWEKN